MPSALRVIFAVLVAFASATFAFASSVTVTVGTSPAGVAFTVDGTQYSSVQTFTWTVGSTHSLSASSPQTDSATTAQYTFSSWSDSGSISHSVTASSSTTSYTASFTTSYELTIATNNSHGTVTPTSGSYYASGSKVSIVATPASGYSFNDWTGSTDVAAVSSKSTTIAMKGPESITANFQRSSGGIQYLAVVFIVTTAADDATGNAANCPLGGPALDGSGENCSLRDALAAAQAAGYANIYFDSTAFAPTNTTAQNTITLTGGVLDIPGSTIINAPTVQNGNTLSNVVTVSGNGQSGVFWVASGVKGAVIQNLNIINGANTFGGAGIYTDGHLRVWGSTIAGGSAADGEGGGIYIDLNGNLDLENSTVSGNSAGTGGGIANYGALSILESTISGNSASVQGGGIYQDGAEITLESSTIAANQATGTGTVGGIAIAPAATMKLTNSIVAGNTAPTVPPDLVGDYTDGGGNEVAVFVNLAPLGNYGGQTQTQIPLPWSPAICVGLSANVSSRGDQRGLQSTNMTYPGYSVQSPCVDSGAVQTNYSLSFSSQPAPVAPASSILVNTAFTAAVTLEESGNPFIVPVTIPLSLTGSGTLTGGSATTANAVATYTSLQVNSAGTGNVLTASLALNPPNSPAPLVVATGSNGFDVLSLATTTTAASLTTPFSTSAQSIALSAQVTSATETVSAGAVTFTVMSGSTVIGLPVTSATISSGTATASYILPASAVPGVYTIAAAYNGGGGFLASVDNTHTLTVMQAASLTAVTSSTGNANLNASVTFTATVTGTASATPTGSVQFMDGTTALGSGTLNAQGVATYATTGLAAGAHEITAVYSGDVDFAGSTSAQYAQMVTAPAYTISANATTLSVASGQSGTVTFTLSPVGGFNGTVNFACSDLPAKASCAFSPTSLTGDGSNNSQTTKLTIGTSGSSSAMEGSGIGAAGFSLLPCVVCGLMLVWRKKLFGRCGVWMALVLTAGALMSMAGCGGSSSKTAAGSYTVVVTASAGSGSAQTVTFTLTVTQ